MVGPFDLVEAAAPAARRGCRSASWCRRGGAGRRATPPRIWPGILDALEAELGLPYPYSKCDVAVVPRFWGTMEHPGLVALGQPLALIPPTDESRQRHQAFASIAIHELAHHWYGDLVTPAWWDDTWLNESFATWDDANVTERVEPAWRMLATLRWSRRVSGLSADVLPSAKRLRQPVRSRHDIEGAFDNGITYDKGASLLTMYEAFLGKERLRGVVKAHLQARSHGVATGEDFLAALSASAGPELAVSFRGFLEQPGVPLLKPSVRCTAAGARVAFTQERFLATGPRDRTTRWSVPVCLRAGRGDQEATVCGLVGGPRGELSLPFCPDWIWPNAGGTGYYLSSLAPGEPARQLPRLQPAEKLALITDLDLLARRGDLPIIDALELVAPLARRTTGCWWAAHSAGQAGGSGPALRRRPQAAAHLRAAHLGRASPGPRVAAAPRRRRRGPRAPRELVPLVAGAGEEAVLAGEALALARRWLADRRQVPDEVAWPALAVAVRHGDRSLFDRLLEAASRATDLTERRRLFATLGSFEEPALAKAALALLTGAAHDRRDTGPILFRQLYGRTTRTMAWRHLTEHWTGLTSTLRADEATWLITAAASVACDAGRRAEVAGFLRPRARPFDGAPRALESALEEASACAAASAREPEGDLRVPHARCRALTGRARPGTTHRHARPSPGAGGARWASLRLSFCASREGMMVACVGDAA